ncbi:MAG: lipopolysaccharide biosynthesis protein [Rhodothermales bacterium]
MSLNNSKFWSNIFYVFQGAVVAQIIPIVSYIFIARLVAPESFGKFSVWVGLVTIGATVVTLRLENMLVVKTDGADRNRAVWHIFYTIILLSCLAATLIVGLNQFFPRVMNLQSLIALSILVPSICTLAGNTVTQAAAAADGRYPSLNRYRLTQSSFIAVWQLILLLFNKNAESIIVGYFLGQASSFLISAYFSPAKQIYPPIFKQTWNFWREFRRFPIFSLPADTISTIGSHLPVILVSANYGYDVSGQLALTMRVLWAPINLVAKALQDVFKRQAAIDMKQYGNCIPLFKKLFLGMLPISLVFILGNTFLADSIFLYAFGEQWGQSAEFAKMMSSLFALSIIASPLSYIVYIVERQHLDLIWQIVLLLLVFGSLTYPTDINCALFNYNLSYTLMYVVYIGLSYKMCAGN